jgi:ParB family transcriptional regulator, chromosome partitioning protein
MRQQMRVKVKPLWESDNDRQQYPMTELLLLGESLAVRQIQPIWCQPDWMVLLGHRRVRAAKAVGLDELDAIVTDEKLSPSERRSIRLTENLHRADLTPYEKWRACEELIALNKGWQFRELAAHLKLDPSSVTRLLSPGKCIPAVQEAFQAARLGITDCYAFSRLSADQQHEALREKLETGMSRDELERVVRRKRNGTSSVKVSRVSIPLASGVTVVFMGRDLTRDSIADAAGTVQREAGRAGKDHLDVKTWANAMACKAKGAKS